MDMPTFNEFFEECERIVGEYSNYRMYILIREKYPPSVAINSTAHGAMNAFSIWKDAEEFKGWMSYSFRKITCVLNDSEFESIYKTMNKHGIKYLEQTENRLDKAHILTVVFPIDVTKRENKAFKYLRLYKDS